MASITGSRERKVTKEFQRLKSHYLFVDHFCLVRRPNEKGHVERLVDFSRSNFLVPVPRVDSLEVLNVRLADDCQKDLQRQLRGKAASKSKLLDEERQQFFRPIPDQTFESHRIVHTDANSLSLVCFDRNDYSVPTQYAHRPLTVVATVDEVRIVFEDRLVARHQRSWKKQQALFDPVHYLALLERKPGGFDHARPLEDWELPVCFGILWRRLEAELDGLGTPEFIKVLRLLESHSLTALKIAVQHALEIDTTNSDAVRLILEYQQEEPVALFCLDGEYIDKKENVLLVGNSGTGKTHIATALGIAACAQGKRVRYVKVTELITQLMEAREDRVLLRLRKQFSKLDVLILDELGYVPASKIGSELLFDVISLAYECQSLIVTTNLPFEN